VSFLRTAAGSSEPEINPVLRWTSREIMFPPSSPGTSPQGRLRPILLIFFSIFPHYFDRDRLIFFFPPFTRYSHTLSRFRASFFLSFFEQSWTSFFFSYASTCHLATYSESSWRAQKTHLTSRHPLAPLPALLSSVIS